MIARRFVFGCVLALLVASRLTPTFGQTAPVSVVTPAEAGFDPEKLSEIDAIVARGIEEKKMPGCVVAFGRQGKLAWLKAYGNKRVAEGDQPAVAMTTDTVFDLASLTKPIATGTSLMLLVEQGKVKLDEPVSTYLPAFIETGDEAANEAKKKVTVRHLLIHTSGLIADNEIKDYADGAETAKKRLLALKLRTPVGENFVYSDVNFMTLGLLIEKVSGQNVHEFSQANIFRPLGMQETGYVPGKELRERAAPTQKRNDQWMQGEVHDPRAYKLNGIAGHAGLFSTANDLAKYASAMLNRGEYSGVKIMQPETWKLMTTANPVPSRRNNGEKYEGQRGLSWDMRTGFSTNAGTARSAAAFGHGGFTGTVIWIDPEQDWFFIFLSNRVHPDGRQNMNPLAGEIATLVSQARGKGQEVRGPGPAEK
ncbi:serine hydrolase domain-containing protein [Anatilimnocola sp. NA78]|uniref:serine hydrolase domain-containing protein n=1 Tax=Anatilimnocola sp. NA78 TaxID=3415683 RepID=UPI003CE5C1B5